MIVMDQFADWINQIHDSIKFILQISNYLVNFLDARCL